MPKIQIEEQLMKDALRTITTLKSRVVQLEGILEAVAPGASKATGAQTAIAKALRGEVGTVGDGAIIQRDGPEAAARLAKARDQMFRGTEHNVLNPDGSGKGRGL